MGDVRIDGASLPDVSDALMSWFVPIDMLLITKSVVDFKNVEVATTISTQGVWQPFSAQQLNMKPQGQRSWKWFMLHTPIDFVLKTDDVVDFQGTRYRVMGKLDYALYGYLEYHLVDDYTGSGP